MRANAAFARACFCGPPAELQLCKHTRRLRISYAERRNNLQQICSSHRAGFHVRTVEEQQDLKRLLQQAGCLEKPTPRRTRNAVAPISPGQEHR